MAGLFASLAVKWACDKLSAMLPVSLMPSRGAAIQASSSSAVSQDLEDLRLLERSMRRIQSTLHDAEEHWNIREESAKLRLKELKELAYDAEDVVEEYEYEVNRCKVEAYEQAASLISSNNKRKRGQEVNDQNFTEAGMVPVPSELAVSARKVLERFKEIKDFSDSFSLTENDGDRRIVPDIRQTSSFVFAPRILGREQDKEKVIDKLMFRKGSSDGRHMSVLAIVGMGGLGKTTLAQLVYNDPMVCQSFDLCAWVYVSEHFDVDSIIRKIISSLSQHCGHIESGELQGALVNRIKDKKVLLVLDDLWNERSDFWELFCTPLLASRCCNIIVTTRNESVARLVQTMPLYNLNCLTFDESWSLFNQTAFVEQADVTPANLVEIGKSIVVKCQGLPLAIKTLGSILRYEADETKWRDVLESELWDLEESQNQILPALELSYKHMPIYLKRCFVALSLFPKYLYLDEARVVWLWKLLGLLQIDGNVARDKIGCSYFNGLIQRSLLQSYPHGLGGEYCVMHDLVHDLACFLAGEEFYRLEADKPIEIPQNARYICVAPNYAKSIQISNASQSLRVIITMGDTDFLNPEALFLNCKKFRTIDVGPGRLAKALLDFMGSMRLLRHFTLKGYSDAELVLPDSLFQLYNLHTLDFGVYMLRGMGRLTNLHTLPNIFLRRCDFCFSIRELSNMNNIRELFMHGLCNVSRIEDANEAHLHTKRNLEVLDLSFTTLREKASCEHTEKSDANEAMSTVSGEQLLESLRPHHKSLKVLSIESINCEKYPSWLGSAYFSKLTDIKLIGFRCQNLPALGELPSLKCLQISSMDLVEHIGREFCSFDPSVIGFPSLTYLSLMDLHRFSEWSGVGDVDFSRLESLTIWSAFELKSLPLEAFSSLHSFSLYECRTIAALPVSATLRELNITECASLTELATLPSLRSLDLQGCPSLVRIGHFPSLTDLSITGLLKDEVLYELLNSHLSLSCLSVWSQTLTSIPLDPTKLPSLRELRLFCPNLYYCDAIAGLSSLRILNVIGSPQLHVPDLLRQQLEKLYSTES